jgi:pimeloyl-ACP methyl ester carboxylesterase
MQHLLLLHGAIGSTDQLDNLADLLKDNFPIHTFNFSGHGGNPLGADAFSIELFAKDVLKYMDENKLQQVSIFGYSMGGYVALYLAKHHTGRIDKVATLATKVAWDETTAATEIQMLNPEKIAVKLPAFAETLRQRHAPADWKEVLHKTAEMMTNLGKNNTLQLSDYTTIENHILLLLGDRDKMVGLAETEAVYRALPQAQLGIIPCTPHSIDQVDMDALQFLLKRFLLQGN